MALSFLRSNILVRHVKRNLYQNKRNAGYVVLIPEIGEDTETSSILTENGLPEFNDVTIEKCIAAMRNQSSMYENGVTSIEQNAGNSQNIFKDIFRPLERLESQLELTWGVAKTLYLGNSSLMPTDTYLKIHERAHKARLTKFNSIPIYNAVLDERAKERELTTEEKRLLNKYAIEGKLNGLELDEYKKYKLDSYAVKLREERKLYNDKVAFATKTFTNTIEKYEIVREFPTNLLTLMAIDNASLMGPWKVTLEPHVYEPFMQYCPVRELRWNAWQAYVGRCSGYGNKELDTNIHLENIRGLRQDRAKLLGYNSFFEMSMETKMAKNIDNVNNMLTTLLDSAKPMQDVEIEALQVFAKDRGFNSQLEHWDIPYWQRRQKLALYNFDEEKVREYFPLPKVINSLFNLCEELFNIKITERAGVHTWAKDVRFYDVFDESSKDPIAGFYLDPYARRDEKLQITGDSGWYISIRNKSLITSTNPLSALIFNFQTPTESKQSLLSFSEVHTLFQKFGHALRHLLTNVNYSEVAGSSNVEWDAAEVCGHVMTHWLYNPATLRTISSHYATGEKLPDDIIQNISNVRHHMAGYNLCKQLYLSKLDLELYSTKTFWRKIVMDIWPKYHVLPFDKYDSHPLTFKEIVSGEWCAAYYCHIWSKMIAADIHGAFEEARQSNNDISAVGKRYRDTFLALGGSCHPSEVFRRFRGRDPSPNALLNNLGLSKKVE